MADKTKVTEIVQYKSEDVSVYKRKSEVLPGEESSVKTDVWIDDVSECESELAQDLVENNRGAREAVDNMLKR